MRHIQSPKLSSGLGYGRPWVPRQHGEVHRGQGGGLQVAGRFPHSAATEGREREEPLVFLSPMKTRLCGTIGWKTAFSATLLISVFRSFLFSVLIYFFLPFFLSACPSVCVSVCLSICLSVCLYVCMFPCSVVHDTSFVQVQQIWTQNWIPSGPPGTSTAGQLEKDP